jgi:hypothetical protein
MLCDVLCLVASIAVLYDLSLSLCLVLLNTLFDNTLFDNTFKHTGTFGQVIHRDSLLKTLQLRTDGMRRPAEVPLVLHTVITARTRGEADAH